ncbi:transcription initiation factor IIA subunit 1 isoform X1 [Anopheles moucheti]|uniref:transcription initiation factor IIA subunit 1 isoform X1 n=1 Tax=Anopheles moucheti TaxID=186751 RepID=UPI0022F057E0|nr:transcription initiation factor IIA subunit 1 isoform X1 [Anopheles moucheti]XP_052901952.1 transcription initiation factor IIA subunit 1 isoform X1 [Anopheles moucheti]
MSLSQTSVLKVYTTVIDDVIAGVRDAFLDEGVDEQVLQEMKQVWTTKLLACKAIESTPESQDQQGSAMMSNKSASHAKTNGTKKSKAATAAASAAAASNNQQENGKANNNTKTNVEVKNEKIPSLVPTGNAPQAGGNQNSTGNTTTSGSNTTTTTGQPQQQQNTSPAAVVSALDPDKQVAIQITLPAQPNVPNSQPRVLTIQVPASALQENQLHHVLTSPIIASIMPLPPHIASNVLQQHVNSYLQNLNLNTVPIQKQLDGACDDDVFMVESEVGKKVDAIKYKLVELPPLQNPLDRCRLDRQLINALTVGQKAYTSDDDIEPIASSSNGLSALRSKTMAGILARTSRRRPLKGVRKARTANEGKQVSASSFHICSSLQLDGAVDTSDEEGSDISDDNIVDDDDEDLDKEEEDDLEAEGGAEEEPLNSEDDVTDEDASDLFDTDNVVVCQYDKITRSRNKWKFYLKDGIMHIGGKDYVFQKSNGDAEW